jgi:type I restriction enzyme S subunit
MQEKKGYKQTEVGVIPEDWVIKNLGEVVERFIGGGTPSRANKEYWGNEIPWVTVKDFATFNPFATQEYISRKGLENSASNLIPKLTLITSTRMGLGKAVVYNVDVSINQDLKALFPSKSLITKYLYYWFQQNSINIERLGSGSTVMGISLNELRNIPFLLPPLPEQTAIANALSDMEALIAQTERLIEKKKAIKQGVMQELLKPKEDWVMKKLGEVCEIVMGQSPLSSNYNTRGIGLPLIQGNADIQNRRTIIRSFTSQVTKKGKIGDIIMSVRAPVGEIAIATFNCCLGRGVCAFRFPNDFLYHYLISIESSWSKLSAGSTFDSVNSNQIRGLEITIPANPSEQVDIANTLSAIDKALDALESKLHKLKLQKQGMMQALLTGKIRLV